MNRRIKFGVGVALLVGAVAYLMYTGVQETSVYYLTIDEFLARRTALADEGVRVAGRVQRGSVQRRMTPRGEELHFNLGDFKGEDRPTDTIPVFFVGVTPDMFKDDGGTDVIVEGTYRDGTLVAQTVMTSCPSKYEAEPAAGR